MNAKDEFLKLVESREVECARLVYGFDAWDEGEGLLIKLPMGFTDQDYLAFLSQLNFTYDEGYGCQMFDGYVWFVGGTWAERGEYDGSEWWEFKQRPEIPQDCL